VITCVSTAACISSSRPNNNNSSYPPVQVALFASRHGPKAIPVEAHEMTMAHEAEGMGALAVTVAFPLKVALEGSPKCPTMAKLRGDFYDSMLKVRVCSGD